MSNVLELAVSPGLTLRVDGRELTVDFPLAAIAKAEAALGHQLRTPGAFFAAKADELPVLMAAGLSRHHPEMTAEDIAAMCDRYTPELLAETLAAFGAIAFPRWTAEFHRNLEKLQASAERGEHTKAESGVVH